ncbi:DUF732 domain-containing protein [Mycobacterium sp. B14F4]|uniref:DUF732 domain-containing protein n=1 Tax=Mycobacterium sp. B14F4 TaxID=3153565 RepID=UPI00325D4604
MKFNKAIGGSLLGLALAIGVATAAAGTAQADPASYIDDLSSAGFYGDSDEALALGYAVCDLVTEGYTQDELVDGVWADTDESISFSDAQYIVESAEIFLC